MMRTWRLPSFFVLAVLAASLGHSPAHAQETCPSPPEAQHELVREIASFVRANDFQALSRRVAEAWSASDGASDWREYGLGQAGGWMRHSRIATERGICVNEAGVVVGSFDNDLTNAVDELRLTFDEATGTHLERLDVRNAVQFKGGDSGSLTLHERIAALDEYVSRLSNADAFSGTVLIARDGVGIFLKSYGFANIEHQVHNSPEHPHNLASLSKMFTAVAILQLIDRGRLRLDSTLADLLPDMVESELAGTIEVRHLLSHTAGVDSDLDELRFTPGTAYEYSNYGFVVLGYIVERVSGMGYEEYLRLHVFGPTGMAQTASYELSEPVLGLATGYEPTISEGQLEFAGNPWLQRYPGTAAGGFYSTVGDLLRFAEALRRGQLISIGLVEEMRTPKPEFGALRYGFGTVLWRGPGIWGHAGDLPGTDADLEIYGDTGYVAIVLGNASAVNPPVLGKIRSLFFPTRQE